MTKKIAVLGANGFIGRHLVTALAQDSSASINAFDRFDHHDDTGDHPFSSMNNVNMLSGNFFNRADLAEAIHNADYVFHLVTSTTPASSIGDIFIDIDTNLRSTIELLQSCAELGVKKIIFPSSGGTIYGNAAEGATNENVAPQPISPYGIIKLTIEHYLRYFKNTHGLEYIVYRIANPYGPGQNIHVKQGVIPIFMSNILENSPHQIYGDGSMVRDYLYIDDLISMIVSSYDKNNQFSEYNLGSGDGVSVNEIVNAIEGITGKIVEKNYIDTPPSFVQNITLDTSRFTSEFHTGGTTSITRGIEMTWNYVKSLYEK